MGGTSDGDVCAAAHVSRVLHWGVQTAARVQLGAWCRPVSPDAGAEFYRLSAAMGSTRILGDARRHEYRRLRALHRPGAEIRDARRERGWAGSADSILRVTRDRAAGD